mgnify:CR=1 FL=1
MGRKNEERECLDQVLQLKKIPFLYGEIIETERPDFIIGSVGLEHFMIEVCQNYEMSKGELSKTPVGSIVQEQRAQHAKYIEHFKNYPDELQSFIDSGKAIKYIEKNINKTINTVSDFSYLDFIVNFNRVFSKHVKHINEYYKRCKTLGFLIEIPYNRPYGVHNYIIFDNGKGRNQNVQSIPFTRDMIQIMSRARVNYIILYMREAYYTPRNKKHCQVIFLDMSQDIEKQLRQQHIVICDFFCYSLTFSNRDVVKFKMEK